MVRGTIPDHYRWGEDGDETPAYAWLGLFIVEGLIALIPAAQRFDVQSAEFALFGVIIIWFALLSPILLASIGPTRWLMRRLWVLPDRRGAIVGIAGSALLVAALIALGWLVTLGIVGITQAVLGSAAGLGITGLIALSPFLVYWSARIYWSARRVTGEAVGGAAATVIPAAGARDQAGALSPEVVEELDRLLSLRNRGDITAEEHRRRVDEALGGPRG